MSLASSTIKTNKKKKDIVGQIKFFFSFLTEGLAFCIVCFNERRRLCSFLHLASMFTSMQKKVTL